MRASPKAVSSCSISAASRRSPADGPRRAPAPSARRPPARNWSRHFETDTADAPSRRAASATDTSPRNTAKTILASSPTDIPDRRPIHPLPQINTKPQPASETLTRDNSRKAALVGSAPRRRPNE